MNRVKPGSRLRRVLLALLVLAVPVVGGVSVVDAAAASDPTSTLADRYAPIVVVRTQPAPCAEGEPYVPVGVDAVLGRNDVVLRGPDGQVVKQAPTAADLVGKGDGYYLDYPGEPLSPGCSYDSWFRSTGAAAKPTLYATVRTDANHPGELALQYWFFYVYNDWNDRHEGDWEMVQLRFAASTPERALTQQPISVAFAQHEGSEVADWNDPKLHKDGDHVVVYPGQGSHAAYFTQSQWFGKSAAAGFGCDNTPTPGTKVTPAIVVIPSGAAGTTGDFAWLDFTGRWGQKAPSFNNGPTGPNTKDQWTEPITWQVEEGRASATPVPVVAGPAAQAFCALSTGGSLLFLKVLSNPWLTLGAVLAVIIGLVLAWKSTRWKGSAALPVVQQRRAGQIVMSSFGLMTRRWLTFVPIGLVLLAGIVVADVARSLLLTPQATTDVTRVGAPAADWLTIPAALIALVILIPLIGVVVSAVQQVLAAEAQGEQISAVRALASAVKKPAGALAFLAMYVIVALCLGSLLLFPVGLWVLSRWAVGSPAAVVEDTRALFALPRSAGLTAGHRWRTLGTTALLGAIAAWIGPVVGAVLLLVTHLPFSAANWITGLILAITVPIGAIGLGLQYFDLRSRQESETEAEPTLVA